MSAPRHPLLQLLPNRVRRNYAGGRNLDIWQNLPAPADTDRPEDWLASTTPAVNPGLPPVTNEGLGRALSPDHHTHLLPDLFAQHGGYYLGAEHLRLHGPRLGYLAKLLDSSMRLHTQAHPAREFARARLGQPHGKLESYVILGARPNTAPQLRLGFQHAPTRDEWRDIIATQNIARMDACFDPIPVRDGEAWLVPGGMPHALGAGLLLLEVMEPSDLVVRCEFEREGIIVPPEGRYMGRDLDFCLDIFDYTQRTPDEIRAHCRLAPQIFADEPTHEERILVPAARTQCFEVRRLTARQTCSLPQNENRARLLIVTAGAGTLASNGNTFAAPPGARFLLSASAATLDIALAGNSTPLEIHTCHAA